MHLTAFGVAAFWIALLPLLERSCASRIPQSEGRRLLRGVDDTSTLSEHGNNKHTLPEDGGYWKRLLENQAGSMNDSRQ